MHWERSRTALRTVAAIAIVATVAIAGAGCDGSETGQATAERANPGPQPREVGWARARRLSVENAATRTGAEDRALIEDAFADIQINFAADQRFVVCGELTDTGEAELSALSRRHDFQGCKNVIAAASGKRRRAGEKTTLSAIVALRVEDDHAAVRVQDPNGETRYVPFVREGRKGWKATSLHYAIPDAIERPPLGPGPDSGDPPGAGARGQVEETIFDVQARFPRGDGIEVCAELSSAGRREVEISTGVDEGDCALAVARLAHRGARNGFQPRSSEILSVRVDGGHATARLRDRGDAGKPPYDIPLVREEGGWRLPSLTLVEPIDLESPKQGRVTPRDLGDPTDLGAHGEIREAFTDVQADFAAGLSTTICGDLSRVGRRELEALAREGRETCGNVVYDIFRWNRSHGVAPRYSRILGIEVAGRRAAVRVKDPLRPAYQVPFARDGDGGWKLVSLARAEPIAEAMARLRRLRSTRLGRD